MQENPSMKDVLINPSGDKAIKLVTQTRSIITLAYESIDVNSYIVHGFTRIFSKKLMDEREVSLFLESIERRVSNIHSQIDLKSAIDIGKQTILLDSSGVKWAIRAFYISLALSLVALFLSVIGLILTCFEIIIPHFFP